VSSDSSDRAIPLPLETLKEKLCCAQQGHLQLKHSLSFVSQPSRCQPLPRDSDGREAVGAVVSGVAVSGVETVGVVADWVTEAGAVANGVEAAGIAAVGKSQARLRVRRSRAHALLSRRLVAK
jgi:hypothetical protein